MSNKNFVAARPRRRRSKNTKKEDRYFTEKTQESIVKFQNALTKEEKNEIFKNEIIYSFEKLVENLINVYRFESLHENAHDLKLDCVHFLFETLEKFKAEKGTKAFSYFNIVARNWLSVRSKKRNSSLRKNISLDATMTVRDREVIEDTSLIDIENQKPPGSMLHILYDIRTKVKNDNELGCINSIITIFENVDEIDLLNKTAVLLYMRELSGLTPKQLTSAMSSIKKHYKKLKADETFLDLFS
jgi:hypothetical protein